MTYQFEGTLGRASTGLTPLQLNDIDLARSSMREALLAEQPREVPGVAVEDVVIPSASPSQPAVRVRVYRSEKRRTRGPAVLHVHGGGFVVGGLENSERRCAWLASQLELVVVSVDYRLAPEATYPAALHDVLNAMHWVVDSGPDEGVDPGRFVLHGVSAGAGLVAASTLYARDHGGPTAMFQYLSIPMLDDRQQTHSARAYFDSPGWNRSLNSQAWAAYLGPLAATPERIPAYAAPARAADLAGLPPAYVSVMQFDPLRDEGIAYANALARCGVPTELHLFPGTFHGSYKIADSPVSRREADEELRVLASVTQDDGNLSRREDSDQ